MVEQKGTKEKKKGFFAKIAGKLDKKMEDKAKKSSSSCCCGGNDQKGSACC